MTKRNWIYVALLVFITFGILVDAIVWPNGPPTLTWNDLIQAIGIVILVSSWQIVDADQLGERRSTAAKILAILVPVGHAIYLYQSRNWKPATALFLLYWAGILIVYIAASFAAGMLVAPAGLLPLNRSGSSVLRRALASGRRRRTGVSGERFARCLFFSRDSGVIVSCLRSLSFGSIASCLISPETNRCSDRAEVSF